jgi:hypothetical protein
MDKRCPHQGGSLGEGVIEPGVDNKCWIRCPWHGWDFDPLTGEPPCGHEDSGQQMYPVKAMDERIYVGIEGRISSSLITADAASVSAAVDMIAKASRPLIIVDYGARDALDKIIELAERLNCPVVTTFKGKGQMPDSHLLAVGVLGRSGTSITSWFMNGCDLQIVFGASFFNHTGIEKKMPTIEVGFEQMALGKFHAIEAPVWVKLGSPSPSSINNSALRSPVQTSTRNSQNAGAFGEKKSIAELQMIAVKA